MILRLVRVWRDYAPLSLCRLIRHVMPFSIDHRESSLDPLVSSDQKSLMPNGVRMWATSAVWLNLCSSSCSGRYPRQTGKTVVMAGFEEPDSSVPPLSYHFSSVFSWRAVQRFFLDCVPLRIERKGCHWNQLSLPHCAVLAKSQLYPGQHLRTDRDDAALLFGCSSLHLVLNCGLNPWVQETVSPVYQLSIVYVSWLSAGTVRFYCKVHLLKSCMVW